MIDAHCHLTDSAFSPDLPAVLARARDAGVERMICIADTLEDGERCLRLAEQNEHIFCTIGVHPHRSAQWSADSGQKLRDLLGRSTQAVAVGEIGLDYHYMNAPKEAQLRALTEQLTIARQLSLPVVLHSRESLEDLRKALGPGELSRTVLHCCTEVWEDVADLVERGMRLSFTGIATYPTSARIRACIRSCPLDRLMVETDAPYLAPVPHRGKRNEPAFVVEVARCVAEEKGLTVAEVDATTTANTVAFFGLPS